MLVRGALSPNIRERRDASSALFDAEGRMVAQAAHIPVHLGAMPDAVARGARARAAAPATCSCSTIRTTADRTCPTSRWSRRSPIRRSAAHRRLRRGARASRRRRRHEPGQHAAGRDGAGAGGAHRAARAPRARGWTGRRGDRRRPARARARERAHARASGSATCARSSPRAPPGATAGARCGDARGARACDAACDALLDYAERRARARLAQFEGAVGARRRRAGGRRRDATSRCPCTSPCASRTDGCTWTSRARRRRCAGNVNCPRGVARAAAVFALRTLLDDDVPTNDGIARAIVLDVPDGCAADGALARRRRGRERGDVAAHRRHDLRRARRGGRGGRRAGAGHDEQRDVRRAGRAGDWTFYETLGGGQGASARGAGPSGVHVGMSNTLNTPVESLERRVSAAYRALRIADASGGAGRHAGGDGVVRAYRALVPCTATLLTERRTRAPQGAEGGASGATGANRLDEERLAAKCRVPLLAGQILTLETPGGGGWGTVGADAPVSPAPRQDVG